MSRQDPMDEFEARIRDALERDGERIRPHGDGLARIRERTTTSRRNWLMAGVIGLATATAIVGAFFVTGDLLNRSSSPGPDAVVAPSAEPTSSPSEVAPTETAPTPTPSEQATEETTEPEPSPTPATTPSEPAPTPELTVPVYYLGDTTTGLRLFREFHVVESTEPAGVTAINEMMQRKPFDPDYSTPWAPDSRALAVNVDGGQITVDLSREVLDTRVPRETADLMVQQLVYTVHGALQASDTPPVQILVGGQQVSDLSGSPITEPVPRAEAIDVQAMTWIIEPFEGETVPGTFTVTGVANAFEATVQWQLVRGGEVVRERFTTAAEGMTFSEYSFTVRRLPPGDYTLRVFQESAEDGSQTFVDTKSITVE